jgi:hypothetical protein
MIFELLPEQEAEKRLRKLKRKEVIRLSKYSKEYRALIRLNVYITNIPVEKMKIENIRQIYRLRWQIELVFKIWKSIGKINSIKKMKEQRFDTMLYAKLIMLILCHQIFWNLTINYQKNKKKNLSIIKTFKLLINNIQKIKNAIKEGLKSTTELFKILTGIIIKKCKLEKKKNSISSIEIMQLKNI